MNSYDNDLTVYGLVRDLFAALAVTCFLYALHRIAGALMLQGRVMAYEEFSQDMAPEEREVLIHKVAQGSQRY